MSALSGGDAEVGSVPTIHTPPANLEFLFRIFRLLGDPTRLSILLALVDGERNVTTLCQMLDLPQPTVSHHLGLMRMNRLIDNRRNGKQVFYKLGNDVDVDRKRGVVIRVDGHEVAIKFKDA